MADNISTALGTPMTVEIKGKEYKTSPLTLNDLGEFVNYIKQQRLKVVNSVDNFEEAEKAEMRREILTSHISEQEVFAEMTTMSGVRFLIYRALRKNENITLENASELVDMSNLDQLIEVVDAMVGMGSSPPVPPSEEVENS